MLEHPAMKAAIWMMVDWAVTSMIIMPAVILLVVATRAHAEEKDKNPEWHQCVKRMKERRLPDPEKRCDSLPEFRKNLADSEKKKQEEAKK